MSAAASKDVARGWRWLLTLAVLLPPFALLAASLPTVATRGSLQELPCWVLPNLRVMPTLGNETCPIGSGLTIARADLARSGDALDARKIRDHAELQRVVASARSPLRLELQAGSLAEWVDVPLRDSSRSQRLVRLATGAIAVSVLLGIPLFLVWRSSSRAAIPLACFYACVSLVLIATLVGQHSTGMTRAALLALVVAPASAIHLSMVFPSERPIAGELRNLHAVPYAFAALLVPVGWVALERDSLLWPAFLSLLIALTAAAWSVLVAACGVAARASHSVLERARARLVLYGTVFAPLIPTVVLARGDRELGPITTAYLWSAAVTMPLPIALAIGRHNLFDLEWDVRHVVARALYLSLAAAGAALILGFALSLAHVDSPLCEPAPLVLLAASCVACVEALRGATLDPLEALFAPQLVRWRRLREELERALAILRDEDDIVALLADTLRSAIALRSCAVLVEHRGGWRLACAFGPPPARDAADVALRLLGPRSLVHLAASSALYEAGAALVATGVESVVAIESGGMRYGLLLLGEPQRRAAQSGVALDFAQALAAQAAIALRNARMTAARVASERQAETGRVALGLAHDVGKDLGWMRTLVKRLPDQIGDPQRLARDAIRIGELTDALAGAIERFVRDATEGRAADSERVRLDAIVEASACRVGRLHGEGRVVRNLDPALRGVRLHESLGRAIGNLLDNALHASPADAPVRLVVTQEGCELLIEIEDSGCGICENALLRVFEPGFTTRARSGGSGVGLPVAGGIVDALGGTLALRSGPCGTRASIRLPLPR